jgi:hypothetical protein
VIAAQADDSAPRAQAAQQGGVSITPARVEATAKRGTVGSFTVKNNTKDVLKVTVTVRPWSQDRNTGNVAINKRANLSPYVVSSPQTFDLSPGSKTLKLNMKRLTAAGSLYGGIQVFAKQKKPKSTNGIIPQFEVIGALRLNATKKRPNLRVGASDVTGKGNNRALILAVRNIGNTLDPVGGTVKITGPTARNATIPQVSVVPGQVVYLKGGALRGMKGGNYTATWSVTQGTKRFTVKRTFKL